MLRTPALHFPSSLTRFRLDDKLSDSELELYIDNDIYFIMGDTLSIEEILLSLLVFPFNINLCISALERLTGATIMR